MKNIFLKFVLLYVTVFCVVMLPKYEVKAAFDAPHYSLETNGGEWDGSYYTINGKIIKNAFFCDGEYTYYLQHDGTPMTDRLTYHPDGEHVIYFDEYGHEVFNDFANVKMSISGLPVDDMCYFGSLGYMYMDMLTYDKEGINLLYANGYGVLERKGWFEFKNSDKYWYEYWDFGYANEDCSLMTSQFSYDYAGRQIYFQGNGKAAKGLITDGQYYYLMDEAQGFLWEMFPDSDHRAQLINKTENKAIENMQQITHSNPEYQYAADGSVETATYYDENGSMTKWIYYSADGRYSCVNEYDSLGNGIKGTIYYVDGNIEQNILNEYDANGNCIKKTYSDNCGNAYVDEFDVYGNRIKRHWPTKGQVYEYDTSGKLLREYWFTNFYWHVSEFDDMGREIESIKYNVDGSIISHSVTQYDAEGNCIKITEYDSDGNLVSTTE